MNLGLHTHHEVSGPNLLHNVMTEGEVIESKPSRKRGRAKNKNGGEIAEGYGDVSHNTHTPG